ncbi:MAG: alpha/beta hydrolase [Myxococcota bacterium]|nr:alpha/beta hydrolase [Myxococcota bacterium]
MSVDNIEALVIRTRDGCVLRGLRYVPNEPDESLPTALCLHGFSSDADSMRWLAHALSRSGMNVIVPDMRAHGLSDSGRRRSLGPGGLSKDVGEMCEQLTLKKIIVITQSFGGWVGLKFLEQEAPEIEIEGLYAFAPNWFAESRPWSEIGEWLPRTARILWRLGRVNGFLSRRKPARLDYDRYKGKPDFHMPRMHEEVRSMSWFTYAPRFVQLQWLRHRPCPDWKSLAPLPVVLVAAREDRLVENSELERIADLTGWPLSWLDCGHLGVATEEEHANSLARTLLAREQA